MYNEMYLHSHVHENLASCSCTKKPCIKNLLAFNEQNLKITEHKEKHFKGRPSILRDVMLHNITEQRNPQLYHSGSLKFHISKKLSDNAKINGKAIPLQAWTGPQGSRRLGLPDFKTVGT
jgi:hypothetical protein